MNFINNMNLKKRLITVFMVIVLLGITIGGIGYWGITGIEKTQDEIALVRLPSIQALLTMSEARFEVTTGERGLMIRQMNTQELRDAQYNYIDNSFETIQKAWDAYEALPKTDEESVLWNEFLPLWEEWVSDHEKVIALSKEKDKLLSSGTSPTSNLILNLEDDVYEASLVAR